MDWVVMALLPMDTGKTSFDRSHSYSKEMKRIGLKDNPIAQYFIINYSQKH